MWRGIGRRGRPAPKSGPSASSTCCKGLAGKTRRRCSPKSWARQRRMVNMDNPGGPVPTITIQMGKPCAECGEGGATDNGLCLACTTRALGATPLKSAIGQAVQERFKNSNKANKEGHSVAKSGFAKDHLRAFIDRI